MAWQDWLTIASLVGVVVAIWLGRRKGRQRFQASIAAARADAASTAVAELTAQLSNRIQIVNANTALPGQADDPLVAALRRLSVDGTRSIGTSDDYRAASDQLDDLIHSLSDSGRSLQRGDDVELVAERSARSVDRSGVTRGLGVGEKVIDDGR